MPLVSESLHLLWPARCAACDRHVPEEALFCAPCNLAINPAADGVCPGCALPQHDDPRELMFAGKRCRRCLRVPLPFKTAAPGFEYGETIAHAIVRMKHGGRRDLAQRLARLLVPSFAEALARARLGPDRPRGARAAAQPQAARARLQPGAGAGALGAHRPVARAAAEAERRPAAAGTQPASPHARDARAWPFGPGGAACRRSRARLSSATRARVRDRRVLLIDDVYTTGATFSECGDALLAAGAADVHVARARPRRVSVQPPLAAPRSRHRPGRSRS